MVPTANRGISTHLMAESIERMAKWLATKGYSPAECERGAVQITLVLSGTHTRAQAREAALEIVKAKEHSHVQKEL